MNGGYLPDPWHPGCQIHYYLEPTTYIHHEDNTCFSPTPVPPTPTIAVIHQASGYVHDQGFLSQMTPFSQVPSGYATPSFLPPLFPSLLFIGSVVLLLIVCYWYSRFLLIKKTLLTPHSVLWIKPCRDTMQSAYATQELFSQIHAVIGQKTFWQRVLHVKTTISCELVATKQEGIRYLLHTTEEDAVILKRTLLPFLPEIQIEEADDYIPQHIEWGKALDSSIQAFSLSSFTLAGHFANSLKTHTDPSLHDPIAYISGNMTKLKENELISFQLVLSPLDSASNWTKYRQRNHILFLLWEGKDITPAISQQQFPWIIVLLLQIGIAVLHVLLVLVVGVLKFCAAIAFANSNVQTNQQENIPSQIVFTPSPMQRDHFAMVENKLKQPLFEASMRLVVLAMTKSDEQARTSGITTALAPFQTSRQAIRMRRYPLYAFYPRKVKDMLWQWSVFQFGNRLVSFSNTIIFSQEELASLYHLPYFKTKTEDLVTTLQHELPVPLSLKRADNLDVVVGKNMYGGEETAVGLRKEDRSAHTYIVGKTGMGKSTIIEGMAFSDIQNNKGVCVIDPHGDLVEHLLSIIPAHRQKDVIYLNPFDKAFPFGLNILNPGTKYRDREEEQQRIAGIVLAIFMKITPAKYWGQRMEHILRNAVVTALQIPTDTSDTPYISLYAIQKLLTDATYRTSIIGKIHDPILKQFWQKEFNLFPKSKQGDLVSPLTNKIGEFITDPLTRYIILQEKSTINISTVMDEGKILLVNLSKGNLGEERSVFFGTVITSLIQLATYARSNIPIQERKDFFVYIDEFQNFATTHFTELFSEARKYHVYFTPSHQNIAQIDDPKVQKIIKGNSGNYIVLKGSPEDEKVLLPLLIPEVGEGQIVNLAPHHFFMKVTSEESEHAFSGITIPLARYEDTAGKDAIIAHSRLHFATSREEVEKQLNRLLCVSAPLVKKEKRMPMKHKKEVRGNDGEIQTIHADNPVV